MTSIKLFAGTDIGLRDNNEDNFTVCSDLTYDEWMVPAYQQEPIQPGSRGCIMAVADGMGGMNAGEVASAIAIETVKQMFSPSDMPVAVVKTPDTIKTYLKKVIVNADLNIKKRCKESPSTEGMGSTIVMAWLIDGIAYIGWMGDSRAYSYIQGKGISRLSKDHSYVQELVDAKMLTEEEAMVHPQSNVITRSLGDTSEKAKPEVVCHPVVTGEIILLCSDGLCGVCTDATIANIIEQESADLKACKEVLTSAALEAGGDDNITISLLQIVETDGLENPSGKGNKLSFFLVWQNILFYIFALALLGILGFAGIKSCDLPKTPTEKLSPVLSDTACTDSVDSDTIPSDGESNGRTTNTPGNTSKKASYEENIVSELFGNTDSSQIKLTPSRDSGDSYITTN